MVFGKCVCLGVGGGGGGERGGCVWGGGGGGWGLGSASAHHNANTLLIIKKNCESSPKGVARARMTILVFSLFELSARKLLPHIVLRKKSLTVRAITPILFQIY